MEFSGIRRLPVDVPLVELETIDGGVIDLYNEYFLGPVQVSAEELIFPFRSIDTEMTARLQFVGVRHLAITQADDWVQEEADQIEHLLIRRSGPWPQVVLKAGGRDYEFDCVELRVVLERS